MGDEGEILSATDVIGNQVKTSDGKELGLIEELIIDKESGRIIGALLSQRDLARDVQQLSTVPWDALRYSKADGSIYVEGDPVSHRDHTKARATSRNVLIYTSSIYRRATGIP